MITENGESEPYNYTSDGQQVGHMLWFITGLFIVIPVLASPIQTIIDVFSRKPLKADDVKNLNNKIDNMKIIKGDDDTEKFNNHPQLGTVLLKLRAQVVMYKPQSNRSKNLREHISQISDLYEKLNHHYEIEKNIIYTRFVHNEITKELKNKQIKNLQQNYNSKYSWLEILLRHGLQKFARDPENNGKATFSKLHSFFNSIESNVEISNHYGNNTSKETTPLLK